VEIAVDKIPRLEAEPMTVGAELPMSVGEELKAARVRMGMSLSDLGAVTRVPMRHLEAIERSEFSALPGHTYTIGFVRSYARAVALDDIAIVNALRVELSSGGHDRYAAPLQDYEPADPARVPSKTLAWTAAAVAALVSAAYLIFKSYALVPTTAPPTPASVSTTAPKAAAPKPVATLNDGKTAANVGMDEQAPLPITPVTAPPTPVSVRTTAPKAAAPKPVATLNDDETAANVGMDEQAPLPSPPVTATPNQ
jgi:cytoskeletal protein RodZ